MHPSPEAAKQSPTPQQRLVLEYRGLTVLLILYWETDPVWRDQPSLTSLELESDPLPVYMWINTAVWILLNVPNQQKEGTSVLH